MAIPATLLAATGAADVQFNGDRPWDLQVHRRQFYGELLRNGSLALGDGYVRGDWDCDHLSEMISRLLKSGANRPLALQGRLFESIQWLSDQILNPQGITQSLRVGRRHYDIDPRVYEAMLGPSMAYSCGYWRHATNLDDAQEAKLHLVCKKLELKPGDRLLDVGCGWGALARVASQHYGAEVVAITISNRQASYIREKFSDTPITVGVCDYRGLPQLNLEPFDKVASIGMFEHVGRRNDRTFHQAMNDCLNPEGLMLLHTIGSASTTHRTDRWIDTHIFPGGRLPSAMQLCKGLEGILLIEDWESFGQDYERTLLSWWENFELAWPRLCQEIGQDFYRFWRYYLLSCAGYFRSRQGQLWQLVLSRADRQSTYRSIRPSSDEWISTSSPQDAADSGQECCIN
jgi:cyclopropane-fatty-acyl-phospholipid synthase